MLDCIHLNYPNLIPCYKTKKSVKVYNNESIPLDIFVQDDSIETLSAGWKVEISPTQVQIPAKGSVELEVSVEASKSAQLTHGVKIRCKGLKISKAKSQALTLTLNCIAHDMAIDLNMEEPLGQGSKLRKLFEKTFLTPRRPANTLLAIY